MFHIKFINLINNQAQIDEILFQEGDTIESGSVFCIVRIDTEKVKIFSPVSGIINKIFFKINDFIKTNDVLLIVKSKYSRKNQKIIIEAHSSIMKRNLDNDFKFEIDHEQDIFHNLIALSDKKNNDLDQIVNENIVNYSFNININVKNLIELKQKLTPHFEKYQIKLTYLPFIIKAVCLTLKEYPKMNYFFNDKDLQLILKNYHNFDLVLEENEKVVKYYLNDIAFSPLVSLASICNKLNPENNNYCLNQVPGFVIDHSTNNHFFHNQPVLKIPKINEQDHQTKNLPVSLHFNSAIDSGTATKFLDRIHNFLEQPEVLIYG